MSARELDIIAKIKAAIHLLKKSYTALAKPKQQHQKRKSGVAETEASIAPKPKFQTKDPKPFSSDQFVDNWRHLRASSYVTKVLKQRYRLLFSAIPDLTTIPLIQSDTPTLSEKSKKEHL